MTKEKLKKEFENGNVVITEDNIALYYEFMGEEDKNKYKELLSDLFIDRHENYVLKSLNLDYFGTKQYMTNVLSNTFQQFRIGLSFFGIKDTLKPIDEYIEEIKASSEYKEYIESKSV